MSKGFLRYQMPAIIWAVLIFVLSSIPSDVFPDLGIFRFDKVIHAVVFALFALLVFLALRHQQRFPGLARHSYSITILIVILYGAVDEFHQRFVAGRSSDLFDLIADALGACVVVFFLWLHSRRQVAPPVVPPLH